MKNSYLKEAIRIGDQLLSEADHHEYGIFWKTADLDTINKKINWIESENLYNGTSGIALFLIELYNQTAEKKYLETAARAMQWIDWYCKNHPTNNYAFLTGRMGISFVYLRLYWITNEKAYITKALAIAKNSLHFLEEPHYINEYINGIAGTLLGLIHLHAATNEAWILDYIKKYIDALLKNARFGKIGLYWDVNPYEIRPLCGFSHGSSGIGYVFLELGHYFQNPAFYYVAQQAFAYENYYFDKQTNNWPDFRINMYSEANKIIHENAYKKGQIQSFMQKGDMNAWCHGAAGIGLSRLQAFTLFNNEEYTQDIKNAYWKTLRTSLPSFTLCHGNGGNADFFIEYYLVLHNAKALEEAKKIAQEAIRQKENKKSYISGYNYDPKGNPEDPSLFNGVAGIGYFLLRVANPKAVPSLLAPKISSLIKQPEENKILSKTALKQMLLDNRFPKTIEILQQAESQKFHFYLSDKKIAKDELGEFIIFVKKLLNALGQREKVQLKDIFIHELTKIQFYEETKSNGLLFIKNRISVKKAKKLLALPDNVLFNYTFKLSSDVKLLTSSSSEFHAFLLRRTAFGTEELPINEFCYNVLHSFTTKQTINEVGKKMNALYNFQRQNEKRSLKEKTISQIKQAIQYTVLLHEESSSFS